VLGPECADAFLPGEVAQLLCTGGAAVWIAGRHAAPRGDRVTAAGFDSARSYALLPPATGKIMLPLTDRRLTGAGLMFYTPGQRRNRFALRLAGVAVCLGCQPFRGGRVVVSRRQAGAALEGSYLLDRLSGLLGKPAADATIHSGWRKRTLLLLDEGGQALGVAKAADSPAARGALTRETEVLNQLSRVAELRDCVPAVTATGQWSEQDVQVQSTAPLRPGYSTALTEAHMAFLKALTRLDRRELRLTEWPHWENLRRDLRQQAPALGDDAQAMSAAVDASAAALGDARVSFHRVHGDFAPWNVKTAPGQFVVVDWEDSEAQGLPFYDLVHFAARVARLLKRKPLPMRELLSAPLAALPVSEPLEAITGALLASGACALTGKQREALLRLCLVKERLSAYHI
jgi:hypothetical protein